MNNLTGENYYDDKDYFSVSEFKRYRKCTAMAVSGWEAPKTKALFLGSFMDALLVCDDDECQRFMEAHRGDILKKDGRMYADVSAAVETFRKIKEQPYMMNLLSGEHQVIMTGEIEGVPFKIKMDSYKPGEFIADMKYMASLRSPNMFTPMVEYWGYDIQAACYQEIVRQNTGLTLPFYFVVATKESPPHLEVGEVSEVNLGAALQTVREELPTYYRIKKGELPPERCEAYDCAFCTTTKQITRPLDTDLFGKSAAELKSLTGIFDNYRK